MYIGFCPRSRSFSYPVYYHYIIIWNPFSVLRLHTYWRGTLSYAFSRSINSIRCRTANNASAIPPDTWHETKLCVRKPFLNNPFPSLQCISASSLCNPPNPGCFTPLYKLVQSDYLSIPLILYSCSYSLSIRLITYQSLLLPNTYTYPLEPHQCPLSLPFSFVITLHLPHSCRFLVLNHHLAVHPQRQTYDSLHSAANQNIPSVFPCMILQVVRPLSDCSWWNHWPSLSDTSFFHPPVFTAPRPTHSLPARWLRYCFLCRLVCLPVAISAFLPSWCFPHLPCFFHSLCHFLHLIIPSPCLLISWGSPPMQL